MIPKQVWDLPWLEMSICLKSSYIHTSQVKNELAAVMVANVRQQAYFVANKDLQNSPFFARFYQSSIRDDNDLKALITPQNQAHYNAG